MASGVIPDYGFTPTKQNKSALYFVNVPGTLFQR